MPYSPPLTFNFVDGGYFAPSSPINFDLNPAGVDQTASPESITGEFGLGLIFNGAEPLPVEGFETLEFGAASVDDLSITLPLPGWSSGAYGLPLINLKFDQSQPVPGITGAVGQPTIARTLVLTFGGPGGYTATLPLQFDFAISETAQAVYAPGLIYTEFGISTVAVAGLEIQPEGFDAGEYGSPLVDAAFRLVEPLGIYEMAFGTHDIRPGQQFAAALGFDAAVYGSASVENLIRFLQLTGFDASAFGTPVMELGAAGIFAEGWDSLVIGPAESPHAIAYYTAVLDTQGADSLEIGAAFVADAIRLLRPEPVPAAAWGDAEVTNYTRTVAAIGERTDTFGEPQIGTSRELQAFGFESLAFGAHTARDDRQFTTPAPITGEYGLALVRRQFEFVRPSPAAQGEQWGDIDVFNRTQRIAVRWPEEYVAGPVSAPVVELQDRQVFPLGFDALRFGPLGPGVNNGIPPIQPSLGITAEWGFALVAPRVRSVAMVGRTMEEFSSPIVVNAAANFTPTPFTATLYGEPVVLNLLQFSREITAGATLQVGTPFVAPRVRQTFVNGIFAFEAGRDHRVSRSPQVAAPSGIVGEFGLHEAANRPRRFISVRQDQPGTVERPEIANRNRRVFALGFTVDTYGTPDLQLYTREIRPVGIDAFESGPQEITDRVRTLRPVAFNGAIGNHRARLFPEPPVLQYVEPPSIESIVDKVPKPVVSSNGVLPEGIPPGPFGIGAARLSGIFPQGFLSLEMASTRPVVISYQLVLLGPTDEFPNLPEHGIRPPAWDLNEAPRISPYTVWAPTGGPAQAQENHPPGREEPIGIARGNQIIVGGLVENPFVSNYRREVAPYPINFDPNTGFRAIFGVPEVRGDGRQFALPQGFRGRWGFPFANGGDLRMGPSGFDGLLLGLASLQAPNTGPRTAAVAGFTGAVERPRVSRNPEEALAFGFDDLRMGGGTGGFGGLWVSNEYPPFPAVGFEATEWGTAFVARNPQEAMPFGWDSFEFGPDEIEQRMRVRARSFIAPLGATTEQFGTSLADYGTRIVQAFSVFKQGIPAPRVQPTTAVEGIAPPTIDPPVIDQVELGTLKAKGADSSAIGHAIVRAAISAPSLIGQVGQVGVYNRLAPAAWSGEFGAAVVAGSADHTCGMQTRGVRHVWTEAEAFGVAEVADG
jgi:hypothetical protein